MSKPHSACTKEITVLSCTLGTERNYAACVRSWLACNPAELIIVTIDKNVLNVERLADSYSNHRIRIYSVPSPNMREQQCIAIRQVTSPYLVFVDDRVSWRKCVLQHIATAFEDLAVGGVTTAGQVVPYGNKLTMWESFGALNSVRRNIIHAWLAYFLNGAVLNLAGRTSAYRTHLIQQEQFYHAITHDFWRGRYPQRTGDDNFLTSWIIRQGWNTCFLSSPQTMIEAGVNRDATYLKQLLRWSRDTARYYSRDLVFAIRTKNKSLIICCSMKIIGNYASDLALLVDIGALAIFTILRRLAAETFTDQSTT